MFVRSGPRDAASGNASQDGFDEVIRIGETEGHVSTSVAALQRRQPTPTEVVRDVSVGQESKANAAGVSDRRPFDEQTCQVNPTATRRENPC